MDEYVATARYGLLRRLLGLFTIVLPSIILIGWFFDVPIVYRLLPAGFTPVNPLTAVLFICTGITSNFLLNHQEARKYTSVQKIVLYAFAGVLLAVSVTIILRTMLNLPLYIDILPFGKYIHVSLMSMNVAICFGFAGVILASLVWVKPIRFGIVRLSAVIILAISLAAVVGYIFNEPTLYSLGVYNPMSLWSAILFALMSGSILRLDYKNAELNRPILISIATMLTVIVCGMSYMFRNIEQQHQIQARFTQVDAITTHINKVVTTALNAEVGVRGYLMTGKESYLDPYTSAQKQYDSSLHELEVVLDDDKDTYTLLERLVRDKNDNLATIITTARTSGSAAGLAQLIQGKDEYLVDQLRLIAKRLLDDAHQETEVIITKQKEVEDRTLMNMGFSGGTVFVFLLVVLVLLMRETMRRIAIENTLKKERNWAVEGKTKDDAILRSIGDGVFALDTEGRIILFNRAAEKISGFKADHVVSKKYDELLHFTSEDGITRRDQFITQALNGHESKMANHTVLRMRNGDLVSVADSAAPIVDVDGKQMGIIVVFRDVTKQRQLEKAKDEFISLASHQLRTPLTSMRLFIEMLLKGQLGELNKAQRRYLKMIDVSTLRMIRLVGDMLNISRIELGKLKIEPVQTDINKQILSHCDDIRPLVKEKKLKLVFKPDKRLPQVMIDPIFV